MVLENVRYEEWWYFSIVMFVITRGYTSQNCRGCHMSLLIPQEVATGEIAAGWPSTARADHQRILSRPFGISTSLRIWVRHGMPSAGQGRSGWPGDGLGRFGGVGKSTKISVCRCLEYDVLEMLFLVCFTKKLKLKSSCGMVQWQWIEDLLIH